jgi:hypothetical protein
MPFDIKTQLYLITFIECAFLLQVFEHKEARLGKVCPVRIAAPLLLDLKTCSEFGNCVITLIFTLTDGVIKLPVLCQE